MMYAGGYEEDIRNMPVLTVAERQVEEKNRRRKLNYREEYSQDMESLVCD